MGKISTSIMNSTAYAILNTQEHNAKSRLCIVLAGLFNNVANVLISGTFFTGFLLANDIHMVDVGIINIIPFIASAFGLLSPMILERLSKRKLILGLGRTSFHILNIIVITFLPYMNLSKSTKIGIIIATTFLAHSTYALVSSGFSVWHIKFIPKNIRAKYFSLTLVIHGSFSAATMLIGGFIADHVKGSPNELFFLVILRIIAFVFAILEVIFFMLPKEPEYEKSEHKIQFKDIFKLPFSNKKFILTMFVSFIWTVVAQLPNAVLNVYLLENVGASYLFLNVLSTLNLPILLCVTPFWSKIISRMSWFKTYNLIITAFIPFMFAYSFINKETYLFLLPVISIYQHFLNCGLNIVNSNMAFINTPNKNETIYISFHIATSNIGVMTGLSLGTFFVAVTQGFCINLGFFTFSNIQLLFLIQTVLAFVVSIIIKHLITAITPDN